MATSNRPQNRLASETSPYLLQHAHNPVEWYPWGPEALERSQREDRPILLSIGYSSCHWCHVMERECFENETLAALMNAHFLCIKVDREERPDLDEVYMAAALAINGNGGWPLTVFCTPEQTPFFAGTYFPPEDSHGRPGFGTLLQRIAELWQNDRDSLFRQAGELTDHLRAQSSLNPPRNLTDAVVQRAVVQLTREFDAEHGGFGNAPKFPPNQSLHFLMRQHQRTENPELLRMLTKTLDGMKNGGIYDHLAGGFARYSVDAQWLVPHFEKMMYDNAQLARVYTEASQLTGDPEYARVAQETLQYVMQEMQGPNGGYYSATDADSEGVEGKYFVFTPKQLRAELEPEETRVFCAYYDVTEHGNWEGTNILHTPRVAKSIAPELKLQLEDFLALLDRARKKVLAARRARVAPMTDDKVLVAWNALMISSMTEAARVFNDASYLLSAKRAADYLVTHHSKSDGRLWRTSRGGQAHLDAVLEDYAYLCDALIDLYECCGEAKYREKARQLAQVILNDFHDPETGAFFTTGEHHEALIVRRRDGNDGALPNASAIAARALLRVGRHYDEAKFRDVAPAFLRAYGERIERTPRAYVTSLNLMDDLLEPPVELVFAAQSFADSHALRESTRHTYLPRRVIGHAYVDSPEAAQLPLLMHKAAVAAQAALYLCHDYHCEQPLTSPSDVTQRLLEATASNRARRSTDLRPARISGFATAIGTARYHAARRLHPSATRPFNDCVISRVGFGTHRVAERNNEHLRALLLAFREGCNLVETASSYGAGESERAVGNALSELIRSQAVKRDELVIVGKLGIIEGEDTALLRGLTNKPESCVEFEPGRHFCIAPEWLELQLNAALDRLNLETLDVCLLHNPELLLPHLSATALESALVSAFRFLETAVAKGQLRHFGVSSNVLQQLDQGLSLDLLLRARSVAGASHCSVVSLPFNVFEREAADNGVLSRAGAEGLHILTQRPLNALQAGKLARLATAPQVVEGSSLDDARTEVANLEHEFRAQLGAVLRAVPGVDLPTDRFFVWSTRITAAMLGSRETWNEFERQVLAPELPRMLGAIEHAMSGKQIGQLWRSWRERYTHRMEEFVLAARRVSSERSNERNRPTAERLAQAAPTAQKQATLSQLALWFASSEPGVTCTLIGMRAPEYVHDALATLRWPDWSEAPRLSS